MQRFDCLDPNLCVKGHYFLEASAGTGKTFAIEHIVVKLLTDGQATLDQILVVTFTRASTRDLRNRIRKAIEKALPAQGQSIPLTQALCAIDDAPIFTIHSFCHRMLTEFAFEAGAQLGEMETGTKEITSALLDFLRTSLTPDRWSHSQIALLMKGGIARLVKEVLPLLERSDLPHFHTYEENVKRLYIALEPFREKPLVDEFFRVAGAYKGLCSRQGVPHEKWVAQIEKLSTGPSLDELLEEGPALFALLAPDNRKKQAKEESPLIDALREAVLPILEEASDVVRRLASEAQEPIKRALAEDDVTRPDDILHTMIEALDLPPFVNNVQAKYRAVIIDEFQDTDPLQWKIFSRLFSTAETFFLVGDPKQSIYSFRGADLYTYLEASESIRNHRILDTNYRSEPALVASLNSLFSEEHVGKWLSLPKTGGSLTYTPVKAREGVESSDFGDGKKAVHFWIAKQEIDEEEIFSWIASEIEWLVFEKGLCYADCAILVRDRFQGQRLRTALSKREIPLIARATQPLKETTAFALLRNLLLGAKNPFDQSAIMQVLTSPLVATLSEEERVQEIARFHDYHNAFSKGGLARLFTEFTLIRYASLESYGDVSQLTELLLEYEGQHRSSLRELIAFLDTMGDEEAHLRRPIGDDDAVAVMTIHMSKGLEFEIVFPLGLMSQTPVGTEEGDAEKMRQLYVAMTRAKRRVYVPMREDEKETSRKAASPLALWKTHLRVPLQSLDVSISYQGRKSFPHTRPSSPEFAHLSHECEKCELASPPPFSPSFEPKRLFSFSGLAKKTVHHAHKEAVPPAGSETGVVFHALLETLIERNLFSPFNRDKSRKLIEQTTLAPYGDRVLDMVEAAFTTSLGTFALCDISPQEMLTEVEFLYPHGSGMYKGFIDLIFSWEGKYYILDWKTNELGGEYGPSRLEQAMHDGDYFLQAQLYATALARYIGITESRPFDEVFGGVYYLFLRGLPQGEGVYFHRPHVEQLV